MSAVSGKGLLLPNEINSTLGTGSLSNEILFCIAAAEFAFPLLHWGHLDWMPLPRFMAWHLARILTGVTTANVAASTC